MITFTRHSRGLCLGLLGVAPLIAGGCGGPLNDSIGLVGVEPLPVFGEDGPSRLKPGPSLTDPTRRDWEVVRIQVPVHQVEYQTTFRPVPVFVDETARQRGDFPNVINALRLSHDAGAQWAEAGVEIASPAISLVALPAEWLGGHGPWATCWGPELSYARLPDSRRAPEIDRGWVLTEAE